MGLATKNSLKYSILKPQTNEQTNKPKPKTKTKPQQQQTLWERTMGFVLNNSYVYVLQLSSIWFFPLLLFREEITKTTRF